MSIPDVQSEKDVVDGTTTYRGEAVPGTADTEKKWKIEKDVTDSGKVSTLKPIGKVGIGGPGSPSAAAEFAWADRADLTYSRTADTTAPILTTVSIASNNGDTTKAGVNNVVTVTIVADKYIENVRIKIAGHLVTAVKGANNKSYTGAYTMTADDTVGAVAFSVECQDIAGHGSGIITAVTDATSVTFDKIIPTATLTYSTDGGSTYSTTAHVKNADTLRIKATISEPLADSPVLKLAIDNSILAATNMTKTSTTVYYYDLDVPAGNYATATCSLSVGKDVSGNLIVAAPTNATFSVDNTAPVFTAGTTTSNNTDTTKAKSGEIVTTTFSTSETLTANPTVTLGTKAMTFVSLVAGLYTYNRTLDGSETEGTCNALVTGTDLAGNVTTATNVGNVTTDFTVPTILSAAKDSDTQITVTLSELALASTITKANDGGFVVAETGTPGTTYAVAGIAPGATNDLVVLTVADMTASATAGVTVTYTNSGNGTVSDRTGNALATDAVGVAIAAWGGTAPTVTPPADYAQTAGTTTGAKTVTVADTEGGSIDIYVGSDDDTVIDSTTGITIATSSASTYDFGIGSQACRKVTLAGPGTFDFTTTAVAGPGGLVGIMMVAVDSGSLASTLATCNVGVTP